MEIHQADIWLKPLNNINPLMLAEQKSEDEQSP